MNYDFRKGVIKLLLWKEEIEKKVQFSMEILSWEKQYNPQKTLWAQPSRNRFLCYKSATMVLVSGYRGIF